MRRGLRRAVRRRLGGNYAVEALEPRRLLSFGADSYFGTGGFASVPMPPFGRESCNLFALPDGRIYVCASYSLGLLTFDGKFDPSFGTGGVVPLQYLGGAMKAKADG